MRKHAIITVILLFFYSFQIQAQDKFMFKQLGVTNGLSHSQINYIFKDSRGFMWFATVSGLNRYDGYNFRAYQHDTRDNSSIKDNYVDNIQEDSEGNLWVHTGSGYVIYDAQKEKFNRNVVGVFLQYGINQPVQSVYIDNQKNIWCYVSGFGYYQYNISSKKLIAYPQSGKKGSLSKGSITRMCECENGYVFVFQSGLIERMDKRINRIVVSDKYIPTHFDIRASRFFVFVDSDGDYWLYSDIAYGVWVFHQKQKVWEFISNRETGSPYHLSSNMVRDITQDTSGLIWLATDHGGINIINKKTGSLINLQNERTNERSISHNSINCIYCDNSNIVWVGTYKMGISYYSESIFKFEVDHLPYFNDIKNFNSDINTLTEDLKGNLWIGTNDSGLICLNKNTGKKQIYQHIPGNEASLANNVIVSLCIGRDGKIWIGTYLGGMDCFDGNRFIHYKHDAYNPQTLANNNVWSIVEDEEGMIWIGTLGSGLQKLNPKTGEFVTFDNSKKALLSSESISSLCLGKNQNLYLGTAIGLTIYNKATGTFEIYRGNKKGNQNFSNQYVNQVYEDSRGLLWIATREGLNIFDRKKDFVTSLHKTDGLADDVISGVIEDNDKNIWVTTSNGVSNIIVNTNPKTGQYTYTFYNYDEFDGLQSREFNLRSIFKSSRGEILMGGIRGYNIFRPEGIKYNKSLPKVLFTGLQLFNEEVKIDSVYNGNRILSAGLNQTKEIELEYRQNVFSIEFSSMNYILPEKTKYAYMLEGFNTDWLIADANVHKVTYTNLAPGTYVFKVKAANSDGYWNEDATTLRIVIKPPFWRSNLAYFIYLILLGAVLFHARDLILRGERNRFKVKQIELEAQRKHEVDDMKLRFFTNISHELRTPLTLIISPLENMMKSMADNEQKQKLVLVHRNAVRLLHLVNQLLDFRKSDVQGHHLSLSYGDVVAYIKGISTSFAEYSEKKNIRLTFFSSIEELRMEFDEDKMGKIMMNLLSNAFKFTNDGDSVEVFVNLIPAIDGEPEKLEVKVADTGMGIKDEDKERIFNRFFQASQTDSHKYGGSGIGLHMVKEFVSLHNGTIMVHDNANKGTVFVFTIPVNRTPGKESQKIIPEGQVVVLTDVEEDVLNPSLKNDAFIIEGRPLILVVDDNDDFRFFMKDSLKGEFSVMDASNGREAWDVILASLPDIIISDVMMPEMDGCELCKLVKTDVRTSHIPLILLTARTAEEQKLEGLETGADDYITKPFNFDILMLRIHKMLELRKARQDVFKKQIELKPSDITITSLDEKLIRKAIKYVEDNINRSELSVEELSKELGMSRVHLYKKLLSITGKSPIEFIRTIRLKRAAQLLRESQQNVSEIAYQVGFNNPKYFSKYFKEEFGVLPSAYQNKAENESADSKRK